CSAQLAEARGYLEPLLTQLAAVRARSEDLDALAADSARAAERLDNAQFWRQHDMAFHVRIAKLSGNALLADSLIAALQQNSTDSAAVRLDTAKCHEQHSEIAGALVRRDGEAAARLMREHLQSCHSVGE